ncbi:MAG: HD domain-containing protein [Bacteroidales bacterium]|nr:HD domain-containing protein [Bacteroidales bacterium]
MFFQQIIDKYYPADDNLRRLLLHHSRQVADRALSIARRHPELKADLIFLENAAMLHDVGIYLTDAPSIHCMGSEPYLLHGRLGAELMRREGAAEGRSTEENQLCEAIARVCERHTGTGLTAQNIREQHLPLPEQDFLPETIEELIVCYADKFYSKSHPERERTVEQTAKSLEKFGHEGVVKFLGWAERFE